MAVATVMVRAMVCVGRLRFLRGSQSANTRTHTQMHVHRYIDAYRYNIGKHIYIYMFIPA